MINYCRIVLILLVLVVELFRKSCKLRSVRKPIGPAIPTVSHSR